jgi:hypothetical protein
VLLTKEKEDISAVNGGIYNKVLFKNDYLFQEGKHLNNFLFRCCNTIIVLKGAEISFKKMRITEFTYSKSCCC